MRMTSSGLLGLVVWILASSHALGKNSIPIVRMNTLTSRSEVVPFNSRPRQSKSQFQQVWRDCGKEVSIEIRVDSGHLWRPPFGVDRVAAPPVVHVKLAQRSVDHQSYSITAYLHGREVERHELTFERNPTRRKSEQARIGVDASPVFDNVRLESIPDEVALSVVCADNGKTKELARRRVEWPPLEVDAVASPEHQINPVDLGAILVPHDWLLLARRQVALINAAAISHTADIPNARIRVWFDQEQAVEEDFPLTSKQRATKLVRLPITSKVDRSILNISVTDGHRQLWKKEIPTMVAAPLEWPTFGAVETKLRYDGAIPVYDPDSGSALPPIDYDTAWKSALKDVVVSLPHGERFVFWRGASYVPMWVSAYNTAASYQWAENLSIPVHHADGSTDLPEPLFDRELRYGRVHIVESTRSRVHVRWIYQLTDNHYNIWGDQAVEDYYFYPDGFGTRVISMSSKPSETYQLTEFIALTPKGAFPFEVLPTHMVDLIFLDGEKKAIVYPSRRSEDTRTENDFHVVQNPKKMPAVYRFFHHSSDSTAAIYFSPDDASTPAALKPFYEDGELVAPAYWGSHWPLTRGKWTHWKIDDGVYLGPAHNSIAGWKSMPEAMTSMEFPMLDALGRSENRKLRRWIALIAKTDASDQELLAWAQSFSAPPSLQLIGARVDFPSYSPARRAMRLVLESSSIEINVKPSTYTVNPVFELDRVSGELEDVTLNGESLPASAYAWDGATLWVEASIDGRGARIGLRFDSTK